MTKNIKFAGKAIFGTDPATTRRILECITTLEKGCEDSQGVFGFHTWNTETPNIFCVLGNRWSLAQNVEHFNENYLEREWYSEEYKSAQKELKELLKDVRTITFKYVEYERRSTFKKCTLTVALREGLFDGMDMTISPIKPTAYNRNSYGFEEGCLDSSCWSLRNLDTDSIPKKYKEILESMNEAEIDAVGVRAGLDLYGNSDYFESTFDFWEEWGEAIADALDEFIANGRVL